MLCNCPNSVLYYHQLFWLEFNYIIIGKGLKETFQSLSKKPLSRVLTLSRTPLCVLSVQFPASLHKRDRKGRPTSWLGNLQQDNQVSVKIYFLHTCIKGQILFHVKQKAHTPVCLWMGLCNTGFMCLWRAILSDHHHVMPQTGPQGD